MSCSVRVGSKVEEVLKTLDRLVAEGVMVKEGDLYRRSDRFQAVLFEVVQELGDSRSKTPLSDSIIVAYLRFIAPRRIRKEEIALVHNVILTSILADKRVSEKVKKYAVFLK